MDRNAYTLRRLADIVAVATREGGVDRNAMALSNAVPPVVATREGGVDRNAIPAMPISALTRSPPARVAWIETALKNLKS